MEDIICDKCGSPNIIVFSKDIPKAPPPKKMSEYVRERQENPSGLSAQPAIVVLHTYIALCKHCGYELEFQAT